MLFRSQKNQAIPAGQPVQTLLSARQATYDPTKPQTTLGGSLQGNEVANRPMWEWERQIVNTTTNQALAGYAFARLSFPGRDFLFYVFLLQLMLVPPILIVPNLRTIVDLGLYGSLLGVMAPYFASAFGTFLMRQTFRQIPRDFEEAAVIDGAHWGQTLWHVLLPMAKPGLVAFSLVSLMAHWNEFLWPLMVLNEPSTHTLTIGLASFALSTEGGQIGRAHV